MNWLFLRVLDWATLVNRVPGDIHNASEGAWADGNHDWRTGILGFLPSNKTLSTIHSNCTDDIFS